MLRGAGDDGYHFWRTLKARSEFKIAMTETPTSAKTASHMVAIPITLLFISIQKYYVEGVTGGAVKG